MTSSYENIYSKFLGLINSYDFLTLSEDEAYELMDEWLYSVIARPKVRKLFSSISIDEELQEVTYQLRNSVDDAYDRSFVEYMLANGMVIGWLAPRVKNNQLMIDQFFGTKEVSAYSQANHVTAIASIYETACKVLDKEYVRDSGYSYVVMNGLKHDT